MVNVSLRIGDAMIERTAKTAQTSYRVIMHVRIHIYNVLINYYQIIKKHLVSCRPSGAVYVFKGNISVFPFPKHLVSLTTFEVIIEELVPKLSPILDDRQRRACLITKECFLLSTRLFIFGFYLHFAAFFYHISVP